MMLDKTKSRGRTEGDGGSNGLLVSAPGAPMKYQWRCDGGCCSRCFEMTTEVRELVFQRTKYHCVNDCSTHSHSEVKSFRHSIEHVFLYGMTKAYAIIMSAGLDIVDKVKRDRCGRSAMRRRFSECVLTVARVLLLENVDSESTRYFLESGSLVIGFGLDPLNLAFLVWPLLSID